MLSKILKLSLVIIAIASVFTIDVDENLKKISFTEHYNEVKLNPGESTAAFYVILLSNIPLDDYEIKFEEDEEYKTLASKSIDVESNKDFWLKSLTPHDAFVFIQNEEDRSIPFPQREDDGFPIRSNYFEIIQNNELSFRLAYPTEGRKLQFKFVNNHEFFVDDDDKPHKFLEAFEGENKKSFKIKVITKMMTTKLTN